ncbi:MAG: hypothetical protein KC481_08970 [Acidimicrobiaceae bacterium]|nr:hypothetical protein [Acidimicrobiaceae bacterium]MDA9241387.1 alpha/beta hydrolase [bacterium]
MVDVMIPTADGESLEAELYLPEAPRCGVVITHPHPQMGGDMHTPVPAGFFRAVTGTDVAAVRFNFRGTGKSTGTHDKGGAERLDVAAALDHLAQAAPGVPLFMAGWSFGADVALTLDDDRIAGWFMAAPPLSVADPSEMAAQSVGAPKVLVIGENDQFNPPAKATATTGAWQNTSIEIIEGADHFFGARLSNLIDRFSAFIAKPTGE